MYPLREGEEMRTTYTVVKCDVCSKDKASETSISVVFTTEQCEGRPTKPYLQNVEIDLCDDCLGRVLLQGEHLFAHGAQGHNSYYFKEKK